MKIEQRILRTAVLAALAGSPVIDLIAGTEGIAQASTCSVTDTIAVFTLKDGSLFVITYSSNVVTNSFQVVAPDKSADLSPTTTNTKYYLANGHTITVGTTRAEVSIDDFDLPPFMQVIKNGTFAQFDQFARTTTFTWDGKTTVTTTGGFTTVDNLLINFTDEDGSVSVYQVVNGNQTTLADGTYDLSGKGDTFTVSKGALVSGQSNFFCYANNN